MESHIVMVQHLAGRQRVGVAGYFVNEAGKTVVVVESARLADEQRVPGVAHVRSSRRHWSLVAARAGIGSVDVECRIGAVENADDVVPGGAVGNETWAGHGFCAAAGTHSVEHVKAPALQIA